MDPSKTATATSDTNRPPTRRLDGAVERAFVGLLSGLAQAGFLNSELSGEEKYRSVQNGETFTLHADGRGDCLIIEWGALNTDATQFARAVTLYQNHLEYRGHAAELIVWTGDDLSASAADLILHMADNLPLDVRATFGSTPMARPVMHHYQRFVAQLEYLQTQPTLDALQRVIIEGTDGAIAPKQGKKHHKKDQKKKHRHKSAMAMDDTQRRYEEAVDITKGIINHWKKRPVITADGLARALGMTEAEVKTFTKRESAPTSAPPKDGPWGPRPS